MSAALGLTLGGDGEFTFLPTLSPTFSFFIFSMRAFVRVYMCGTRPINTCMSFLISSSLLHQLSRLHAKTPPHVTGRKTQIFRTCRHIPFTSLPPSTPNRSQGTSHTATNSTNSICPTNPPQTQWRYRSAMDPRLMRALPTRPPFPPRCARVAGRGGVEPRRGWEVFEREGTGKVIKGRGGRRKGRENLLAV